MDKHTDKLITLLEDIEIPRSAAITYAALLESGSVSIRKLANATGINRGTTYDSLKLLVTAGLVSVKGGDGKRDRYTAESPERVHDIIRDKRRDLLEASNIAKEIVPQLLASQGSPGGKPIVRYYEGDEGVAAVLRDVLQTCRQLDEPHYHAYSSAPVRELLYRNFPQFTERRIAEDIGVSVISVGEGGEEAEKSERKWLGADSSTAGQPAAQDRIISSYTIIYGNKVATISIAQDDTPYGVVIEDAGAAAMQRQVFAHVWRTL